MFNTVLSIAKEIIRLTVILISLRCCMCLLENVSDRQSSADPVFVRLFIQSNMTSLEAYIRGYAASSMLVLTGERHSTQEQSNNFAAYNEIV